MSHPINQVYLVGFMGAGKSAVGFALAKRLGWNFEDSDDRVEQESGLKIATLFQEKGEPYFRDLEASVIQKISIAGYDQVVALGGGAILRPETRRLLKAAGVTVYLRATIETLSVRLMKDPGQRPLLGTGGREQIQFLLEQRSAGYEQADWVLDTDRSEISEVVEECVKILSDLPRLRFKIPD